MGKLTERKSNRTENIIIIEQLPIIKSRLEILSKEIDEHVKSILSLEISDETVKYIKEERAELNKQSAYWDEQRKTIKNTIMAPYNEFEAIYKACVSDKYKQADAVLKHGIDSIENKRKSEKRTELEYYYNDLCEAKGVDFIPFEQYDPNITLSASMKSIKESASIFINRIAESIEAIRSMEHCIDIMAEFKQSLDLNQAISTVNDRRKRVEAEQAYQEIDIVARKIEADAVAKVDAALPIPTELEDDPVIERCAFAILGAKRSELRKLREYMLQNGLIWEK